MGGKESIRGFIYQGFASVLEALTQDYWDRIYVEYPVGNKIDIALELNGCLIKSIQVKSSINLFSKSSIAEWINELTTEAKSKEYSIFLIGSCDEDATTFINAISYYKTGTIPKKSKKSLKGFNTTIFDTHNITITVLPFNESILQSITRDALHRYISFKEFKLEFKRLELISKALTFEQMLLGIEGDSISKVDFDKIIFDWIDLTSVGMLKSVFQHAKHELVFYNQETNKYSPTMSECYITEYYSYRKYLQDYTNSCIKLIMAIDSIKLPTHDIVKPKEKENNITTIIDEINPKPQSLIGSDILKNLVPIDSSSFIPNMLEFLSNYAEISDTKKEESIREIKELFDIDIEKEFFFVGNFKKEMNYGSYRNTSYKYSGSDIEEQKHNMIIDLQYKIAVYKIFVNFINNISMYCVLPIAIHNISENTDENITVKLFIDKSSVRLFQGEQYPNDDYSQYIAEPFCKDNGIISSIFGFKADSNIGVEPENQNRYVTINQNATHEYTSEDFYAELDKYVAQNTYDDKDFYIVELKLEKGLRPKELKFLNKIVILHSLKSNLEIKYKILSNNTDGSNEGILTVIKSNQ
ncbi:hypothetical protein Cpap_4031 [Ruminiclostridium papyrosolvens DSM 2782]|uniref:Uncharacterized protein n=1 Tax=Ruminiclostridium papyrosolvens DSM 2782 TaxID=588581 RepID=F1T7Z5_9FIRM|nr:hypothetical protein [Ruminiclostridium papyrosolvens]EGD49593.1 hypothetical protein Cpap_4031 [Ruminiclostridium papyrosolvens DSM 2782]WES33281.1 hypothetical protein P0092_16145 [Ruminiclostridium papyrosolvens DSM 2782]